MKYDLAENISQATLNGTVVKGSVDMEPAEAQEFITQGILVKSEEKPLTAAEKKKLAAAEKKAVEED